MENNIVPTLTVFEKPSLQDQVVAAAVGTIATIVVTLAISSAATGLQNAISKRKLKKLSLLTPPTESD